HAIDKVFERVRHGYQRTLQSLLGTYPVVIVLGVILAVLLGLMAMFSQSELAPEEDQGIVLSQVVGSPTATADQMLTYADQVFQTGKAAPEYKQMFQIRGGPTVNGGRGGVLLKDWSDRKRSAQEIRVALQAKWNKTAGPRVAAFQFPPLPGSSG